MYKIFSATLLSLLITSAIPATSLGQTEPAQAPAAAALEARGYYDRTTDEFRAYVAHRKEMTK